MVNRITAPSPAAVRGRGVVVPGGHPRLAGAAAGATLGVLIGVALRFVVNVNNIVGVDEARSILAATLVGGLLGATAFRWVVWAVAGALAVTTLLVAYTPLVSRPARAFVRSDAPPPGALDAVVVLSSDVTREGRVAGQGLERLIAGLDLIRHGAAPVLVFTVVADPHGVPSRADQLRLVGLLDPAPRVAFVDSVFSTRDEAVRVARLAPANGWRAIALVTSPIHSRRACATFERVGFRVTCLPAPSREFSLSRLSGAADRLRVFQLVLYEAMARLVYRGRGWI